MNKIKKTIKYTYENQNSRWKQKKGSISESGTRINKDNPISGESRNENVGIQNGAKKQVSPV